MRQAGYEHPNSRECFRSLFKHTFDLVDDRMYFLMLLWRQNLDSLSQLLNGILMDSARDLLSHGCCIAPSANLHAGDVAVLEIVRYVIGDCLPIVSVRRLRIS